MSPTPPNLIISMLLGHKMSLYIKGTLTCQISYSLLVEDLKCRRSATWPPLFLPPSLPPFLPYFCLKNIAITKLSK